MEAFLLKLGIAFASAGILLGIVLSWWATARITRPVKRLAESARKVAAGNWGATVEIATEDEIGQLAHAFNRMTHELVEQRERLVQSERVAAWRELARRLAHELKNPLFPLQITVENMRRAREQYPEQFDEVFREGSSTLLAELANLKQIISRFSDFAKMPAPAMQQVQLNELAAETVKLFAPQLAQADIAARTELDPHLRRIMADPEQLTRVLRNLTLNAIDAMPRRRHADDSHHARMRPACGWKFRIPARGSRRRMRAPLHALLHHQDARNGPGTRDRAVGGERPSRAHLGSERAGQRRDVPHRPKLNLS